MIWYTNKSRVMLLAGMIILLGSSTVFAQRKGVLPGDHIRFEAENTAYTRMDGIVTEIFSDSLQVSTGLLLMNIAWSDIYFLEVREEKTRKLEGTLIGAGVGALFGALIGTVAYRECTSEEMFGCLFRSESRGRAAIRGAILTAIPGGLIGLAIGASTKNEQWERIHIGLSMNVTQFESSYQPQLSVKIHLNQASRD